MPRAATLLTFFFIALNAVAVLLSGMGVLGTLGIEQEIQAADDPDNLIAVESTPDAGGGVDFIGFYQSIANVAQTIFAPIFPAMTMLTALGVPADVVYVFLSPLFSFVITIAVLSFLRGVDL